MNNKKLILKMKDIFFVGRISLYLSLWYMLVGEPSISGRPKLNVYFGHFPL